MTDRDDTDTPEPPSRFDNHPRFEQVRDAGATIGGRVMARHHAEVQTAIWSDPEFLALSGAAQRLYMLLLSQNRLSLAGHLDLMPHRWAALARDTTVESITADLYELEVARFVAVDHDTQGAA